MAPSNADASTWQYYRYNPSLVAAIIFIVLFAMTSFLHLYQMVRTRTWYFIPFVVGGFFEFVGYIGRAAGSQESPNWTLGPFIIQSIFLLVAPAVFAASIYMELGRIILATDGEAHSLIKKKWLTKLFVAGDVLSFMMQSAGGGIMAGGTQASMDNGEKIVIGGLFVQVLFFGFFIITAVIFDIRIHKNPTPASMSPARPWNKHLKTLYFASALIMVRSIFRVIEYIMGNAGYLLRNEVFLYVFDGVLMLVVMLTFNAIHPSEVKAMIKGGKVSRGFKVSESKESPMALEDYSSQSRSEV